MEGKNETIADIVAEKRRRADEIERDVSAKMKSGEMVSDQYAREVIENLRREADRIEAAHKREVQDALDTGGYVEACRARKKSVGNAAKLREVVELCDKIIHDGTIVCNCDIVDEARIKIKEVLSAPPRNCDVGTAEVQAKRKMAFCDKQQGCGNCSLNKVATLTQCALAWAQMPYEEGGSK